MPRNKSAYRNQYSRNICDRDGINSDLPKLGPRKKCFRVSELVYKFLGDVASSNAEKRQRNDARTNFQRVHVRRYGRQVRRPDNPRLNRIPQRAERYMCKALSFGVDAGFLKPTDSQGQVFRVSSDLDLEMIRRKIYSRKDEESKNSKYSKRRKRMRSKSDEDSSSCTSIEEQTNSKSWKSEVIKRRERHKNL